MLALTHHPSSPLHHVFDLLTFISPVRSSEKLHVAPDAFKDRLFVRTSDTDSPRTIYVCNDLVRDIIAANDPARMRLINCGVKTFTRQGNEGGKATSVTNSSTDPQDDVIAVDNDAPVEDDENVLVTELDSIVEDGPGKKEKDLIFRFVYEGVQAVLPFVDPASILVAGVKELRTMLEVYYPYLTDFEGSSFGTQIDASSELYSVLQVQHSIYN